MTVTVGIDFGTTNSSIAIGEPGGAVRLVTFPFQGAPTTTFRSVLYFHPDERGPGGRLRPRSGPEAIEAYLEAEGEGRLIQSLKSYLGSRLFTATQVFTRAYTLENLIAMILTELRRSVGDELGREADQAIADAVIVAGRPVHFANTEDDSGGDAFALGRLQAAFTQAGFKAIAFEHEPVGAAYFYETSVPDEELVLIGDFGGGTSDFCLMRVGGAVRRRGRRPQDIIATGGVGLAGDAFDARLIDHLVSPRLGLGSTYTSYMDGKVMPVPPWLFSKLRRWHHLSLLKSPETMRLLEDVHKQADDPERIAALIQVIDEDLGYRLYRAVEKTKVALSTHHAATFVFDDPAIERPVSRTEFEAWIGEELRAIAACVDDTLLRAGVQPARVDRVFLTGGSSFIPAVRAIFEDRFGPDKLRGGDELTSVAHGLALRARDPLA